MIQFSILFERDTEFLRPQTLQEYDFLQHVQAATKITQNRISIRHHFKNP